MQTHTHTIYRINFTNPSFFKAECEQKVFSSAHKLAGGWELLAWKYFAFVIADRVRGVAALVIRQGKFILRLFLELFDFHPTIPAPFETVDNNL